MAQIAVTYYTDPLCSWSWAFEPVRRRLYLEHGDAVQWTIRLGGMLPEWTAYRDPLNAVHRPAQMAPAWYHTGRIAGVRIDPAIWHVDPPASSYPACLAVKAAERQGRVAAERYLEAAREAVMTRRLNVARAAVLIALAKELETAGVLDAERFAADLTGVEAAEAFAGDLREVRARGIGRFPSFVVAGPLATRLVVGYRPFELFLQVLEAAGISVAPQTT